MFVSAIEEILRTFTYSLWCAIWQWPLVVKNTVWSYYYCAIVTNSAVPLSSMELLGHCCDSAAYLLNHVSCHNKQLFSANNLWKHLYTNSAKQQTSWWTWCNTEHCKSQMFPSGSKQSLKETKNWTLEINDNAFQIFVLRRKRPWRLTGCENYYSIKGCWWHSIKSNRVHMQKVVVDRCGKQSQDGYLFAVWNQKSTLSFFNLATWLTYISYIR